MIETMTGTKFTLPGVSIGHGCGDCFKLTVEPEYLNGAGATWHGVVTFTAGDCYVIEFSGLKYHGQVTRVLIPVSSELHSADRRNAPFCEWCGQPGYHNPGRCRDWYRRTGTLFTGSEQWKQLAEADRDRLAGEIRHRAADEQTRAPADTISALPAEDPRFLQAMPWFGSSEDCYLDMLTNDELSKIAAFFES